MSELRIETVGRRHAPAWEEVTRGVETEPAPEDPPAQMHRLIAWRGGAPVGRVAFGTVGDLAGVQQRAGVVGWYEARDEEAGVTLLERAKQALGKVGAEEVIGPLDWSTWRRYRLALRPGDGNEPSPFLTEPWNPPDYPRHFERAGFEPLAEYESRIAPPSPEDGVRALQARNRLIERGIEVLPLRTDRFEEEMERVHALVLSAFAGNPYFSPVSFERFSAQYGRMQPLMDPAFVHLAHGGGELVGFVFAFPDPLAPEGERRVVLKTLAVSPDRQGEGVGAALVSLVHGEASSRGASVIHALMEAGNPSRRISTGRVSQPFRTYRLYAAPAGE